MDKNEFLKNFQQNLKERFSTGYQNWWSDFIFHFTNINNAASILNSNYLYSRNFVNQHNLMLNDNADKTVIQSKTPEPHKDYVRFYFAAKTPTQYHNEGIKSGKELLHGAHCPIPVFFLFDFISILSINGVKFSSGNIANHRANIYSNIADLCKLEFENIYKDGSSTNNHERYCRHAEVLVQDKLQLNDSLIKHILVRSKAEKETLLFLLSSQSKIKYGNKIKISTNGIYFSDRYFLDRVVLLDSGNIEFLFLNHNQNKDFTFKAEAKAIAQNFFHKSATTTKAYPRIIFMLPQAIKNGLEIKLYIDDNLIYHNILYYYNDEIPF